MRPRLLRSGSPRMFMGCGVNPKQWWAKGSGPTMELGRCLKPLDPLKGKINVVNGLFNKHALGRRHPSRPDRQHPLGRRPEEGRRTEGRRSASTRMLARHLGETDRPAEHGPGLRAADHRLPRDELLDGLQLAYLLAECRPRRCRWRSIPSLAFDASSTTAGASRTKASSTASATRPTGLSRRVERRRPCEARRVPDQRPRGRATGRARCGPRRRPPTGRAGDRNSPRFHDAPARQRPARGHP